ncbi:conjugal transfer protein TraF [Vibrio neonatus]|uniref:conjugal transfer protein TraF n=1 Tax=Vibrio neonatus TaxID=278860 RepID=UPI0021C2AECF|nr:conjugal transfer protein TraF [Vibrio neonatus]
MKYITKVGVGIGALFAISNLAHASNYYADGRTTAMGGTGVASGNYLSASFINPALLANSKESDSFGILLPSIGVRALDQDDTLSDINDLQDNVDNLNENSNQEDIDKFADTFNAVAENAPVFAEASVGIAVAIPFETVSVALFSQNYVNVVSMVDAEPINSSDWATIEQAYRSAEASVIGVGVMDIGVTLAKQFSFDEHRVSVGFSPKFQQLHSYYSKSSLDDFELSDYDDSKNTENVFNLDVGFLYQWHALSVGLSAKNLISNEIETAPISGTSHTYQVDPNIAMGVAYQLEYFTVAVDGDLNKQTRFKHITTDDTQFIRAGVEGNLFNWAQLRVGYEHDLEGNFKDSITAGIGLSPFDVVHIDIAGSYADETQAGIGLNLSLTL